MALFFRSNENCLQKTESSLKMLRNCYPAHPWWWICTATLWIWLWLWKAQWSCQHSDFSIRAKTTCRRQVKALRCSRIVTLHSHVGGTALQLFWSDCGSRRHSGVCRHARLITADSVVWWDCEHVHHHQQDVNEHHYGPCNTYARL